MHIISYFNPDTLQPDRQGVFGLLADMPSGGAKLYPIGSLEFNIATTGNSDIQYISLQIDHGNCSLSKEYRKSGETQKSYWYASKRINGKLKRLYLGSKIYQIKLFDAISHFNALPNIEASAKPQKPNLELPGHGKSDRHLQTSLLDSDRQLSEANQEIGILWGMINDLRADLEAEKAKEHEQWQKRHNAEVVLKKCHETLQETELQLSRNQEKLITRSKDLAQAKQDLAQAKQDLAQANNDRAMLTDKLASTQAAQSEISEIAKPNINQSFKRDALLEKYRSMSAGKNKKANPRFAYLLDLFQEIDKL